MLYQLFLINQPQPEKPAPHRISLIERIGLEFSSGKTQFSNALVPFKRKSVRNKSMCLNNQYKAQTEPSDEILNKLCEIFRRNGNNKGRMIVRDFYDAIVRNNAFGDNTHQILNELKFRLNSEISFEDVKSCIEKRRLVKRNTIDPIKLPRMHSEGKPSKPIKNIAAIKAMFDQYDVNKDGILSLQEFKRGLREKFNEDTLTEIFHEYDADSNGVLDFNEFLRIFSPDKLPI